MMRWQLLHIVVLLVFHIEVRAQTLCNAEGQTPGYPFTICGNGVYVRPTPWPCWNGSFYLPGCTNEFTSYGDLNPVYFKFTCKKAGSFGFMMTSRLPEQNIDWQLFDITGRQPNEIFTDKTLTVAANWSGGPNPTGASSQGNVLIQCRTLTGQQPQASPIGKMPDLKEDHTYLLLASGDFFALTVEGGTADISGDVAVPLKAQTSSCSNNQLIVVFSKPVKCSSITPSGTEFALLPNNAVISSVTMFNCSADGGTDSILLSFSQPLAFGNYSLFIKNGTDGNTILDNCDNILPDNTELKFTVLPYPVIDSIISASCTPSKLTLRLSKQTLCNSIAADGSDFSITGPSAISIRSATANCNNGEANEIELVLQNTITIAGTYSVQIKSGTDGASITDGCNNSTPAGTLKSFLVKGAVNADFNFTIAKGCNADTVTFNHPGGNNINVWNWNFSNNTISSLQQPAIVFTQGGTQTASLSVSNGQCNASLQKTFILVEKLKADFELPAIACSNQLIAIVNRSTAAINYSWDFGNGSVSNEPSPASQTYPAAAADKNYTVTLTVQNNGCSMSISKKVLIKSSCFISMPNAFTPNADGLNDLFGPINSYGIADMRFQVFNRFGQQLFQSNTSATFWNGTYKGFVQAPGLYIWTLEYTEPLSNKKIKQRGTVLLLR